MSNNQMLVLRSTLSGIVGAIRSKSGSSDSYLPSEMAEAIAAIPSGGEAVIESKSVTANGTYTAPTGVDGFSPVVVNVANSYAAGDEGKVVSNGELAAQTARSSAITENGTYDTTTNNSVTVNVSGGGGSVAAFLAVRYPAGSTVSCTDGTTTLTSDTSGDYIFLLPNAGTWTVTFASGFAQSIAAVYGYRYDAAEYLPESSAEDVLAQAYYNNFDASSASWGGLLKADSSKYEALPGTGRVRVKSDTLRYEPQSGEVSFTAYFVLQSTSTGLARILSIYTSESNPGKPTWFHEGGIYKVYDNGNANTTVSSTREVVLTVSRDAATGTVKWYINGTLFRTSTGYTATPAYIYFDGTGTSYRADVDAYYMGVVLGAESEQTVIANQSWLMDVFGIT